LKEFSAHFLGFFLMGLETSSLEGSCEEGFLGYFFPPGAATLLFSQGFNCQFVSINFAKGSTQVLYNGRGNCWRYHITAKTVLASTG
jgi:hypothetical protein